MKYSKLGKFDGGVYAMPSKSRGVKVMDAGNQSSMAFLVSELEKRDPDIKKPLTSVTFTRDIPVKVGGGWVDTISAINVDYGVTGGSNEGNVTAAGANGVPVIQMNLGKDTFGTHIFSAILRIPFADIQRENLTGRSLDEMLKKGVRLNYDKHLDANCYVGISKYNTTGLINNPNIAASNVATGAASSTQWSTKTPDEILFDINTAIEEVWEACGFDMDALPNHIIMPHSQYTYIATTKVSALADKTILSYVLENNIATKNGKELVIGATAYCKGAGASNTDRMAVYVNNEYFVAMEELSPLAAAITSPNTDAVAYDTVYMANLSEVEIFYTQAIRYYDGI